MNREVTRELGSWQQGEIEVDVTNGMSLKEAILTREGMSVERPVTTRKDTSTPPLVSEGGVAKTAGCLEHYRFRQSLKSRNGS
jgi:hypothetical protein